MTYERVSVVISHLANPELYKHIVHYGMDHNNIIGCVCERLVSLKKKEMEREQDIVGLEKKNCTKRNGQAD